MSAKIAQPFKSNQVMDAEWKEKKNVVLTIFFFIELSPLSVLYCLIYTRKEARHSKLNSIKVLNNNSGEGQGPERAGDLSKITLQGRAPNVKLRSV